MKASLRRSQGVNTTLSVPLAGRRAEARLDFDSLYRTAYLPLVVGADGSGVDELLTRLRELADLGFQAVLGFVPEVHTLSRLEVLGSQVIPVAAQF